MVMIIGCHIVSFIAYNGDKFYGDFYILGSLINRVFLGMLAAFGRIGVGLFFFITGYFHIFKQTVDFKVIQNCLLCNNYKYYCYNTLFYKS